MNIHFKKKYENDAVKEENREIWHMLRPFIIIVVMIAALAAVAAVGSNVKKSQRNSEYIKWSRYTLPKLNEMYANKQYEEILEIYEREEGKNDSLIYTWDHCDFFSILANLETEYKLFDPNKIDTWGKYKYRVYLEEYCILKYMGYDTRFDHDNQDYIKSKYDDFEKKLAVIYPFTDKEDSQFLSSYKKNNFVDLKLRDEYLKKYFKKYNIKKE